MSRTRTTDGLTAEANGNLTITYHNDQTFQVWLGNFGIPIPAGGSVSQNLAMEYGGSTSVLLGSSASITDQINPGPLAAQKAIYNPCHHTVRKQECGLNTVSWSGLTAEVHDNSGAACFIKASLTGSLGSGHTDLPNATSGLPADAYLIARATSTMNPGSVPPDLDLPRFIAELTDFKELWVSGWRAFMTLEAETLKAFLSAPIKALKFTPREGVEAGVTALSNSVYKAGTRPHTIVGSAVNADLAWKLAIRPFLKDVEKLGNMLERIDSAYTRMLKPEPIVVRGKASEQTITGPVDTVTTPYFKKGTTVLAVREAITWATVKRSPVILSQWEALKVAYGINPRIRVVWELVPLSFVIDWFISVGKFLGQFDGAAITVPYLVVASGASIKTTLTYSNTLSPLKGSSVFKIGTSTDHVIRGMVSIKQYDREPMVLPWGNSSIAPIQTRLPNFGQVGTLVELIYSALPSRRLSILPKR